MRKRRQSKEATTQSADKTEKKKGKRAAADVDNIEKELGTEAAAAETEVRRAAREDGRG